MRVLFGIHRVLLGLYLLGLLVSCTPEEGIINPSDIKIYVNNTQGIDVFATDITPISGTDFLVFGICGNAPESRFDGNGSIYLRKINDEGKTDWDTCFSVTGNPGFPTNLVKLDNQQFVVLWNDFSLGAQKLIEINLNPNGASFTIAQSGLNCNFNCGVVMFVSPAINSGQLDLLGVGFDPVSNLSTSFVSRFDPTGGGNQARSQRIFSPQSFGGVGQNDLNLLKSIENYLYLTPADGRLLFTAPLGNKMSMSHVGEIQSVYQDELFWISAVAQLESQPNAASVVISSPDRPDNPSFLIPEIALNELPSQMDFGRLSAKYRLVEMFDLDAQSRIFIKGIEPGPNVVVAGNSRTGQPVLYVFDGQELTSKQIGNTTEYSVGGIAFAGNGQDFVLVGVTKVENRDQRLFWIKIDINELLAP